jgi:ABC-2 type transport system ATP-binding protein
MTSEAIEIQGLAKTYGSKRALDGLNLTVPRGAIAGFVGLNGAGKTTTLRILLQMAKPTAGAARVLGLDALDRVQSVEIRRRTAFMPERKELFPYMKVRDAVAFTRSFYPRWREAFEKRLADDFGLDYNQKITQLSKGTLTKLHLLLSLARGAELILLDEPTDGLDPLGVEVAMKALVSLAAEEGSTILFSSHRLNEMEQVADYLCMIHQGRSLMEGPLDDLKQACRKVLVTFPDAAETRVREFAGAGPISVDGRGMTVLANGNVDFVVATARNLGARSVDVQQLAMREMFLELVKGAGK